MKKITFILSQQPFIINSMLCIKSNRLFDKSETNIPYDISQKINAFFDGCPDKSIIPMEYHENRLYNTVEEHVIDCSTVAYIFNIFSEKETHVILISSHYGHTNYLWVNDSYIGQAINSEILKITLQAGNNIFCYIFPNINTFPKLTVRVNCYETEQKNKYVSLTDGNFTHRFGRANIQHLCYDRNNLGVYKGLLYSYDQINIDITQRVTAYVIDYYTNKTFDKFELSFNNPFEIDLRKIDFETKEYNSLYGIRIKYCYRDKKKKYIDIFFSFENTIARKERVCAEAKKILNDSNLQQNTMLYLKTKLDPIKNEDISNLHILIEKLWTLEFAIINVLSGEYPKYKYKIGKNLINYFSEMDSRYYRYFIYLPENYDKNKKYPLVLHYTCSEDIFFPDYMSFQDYNSQVIIAQIPSKGVTLGSYIGEAIFYEVLTDIKKRFLIEETRISLFGYSSGATATWLLAQSAPHMFAAVAPVAGSFHPNMIKNLKNIQIFDIESKTDMHCWPCVSSYYNEFNKIKGYSLIEAEMYSHALLQYIYANKNIIELLPRYKVDEFPEHISFFAIHNRHLKAYWITIHSIEDVSEYGNIEAQIETSDTINIECSHITGFTIFVPPQIQSNTIKLKVNGQALECDRPIDNKINIIKLYDFNLYSFGMADSSKFKIYHGTGLLDVYLKPMSILNCDPNSDEMNQTALQFSSPRMNTHLPTIYVSYPIFTSKTIEYLSFKNRSLIVLDNNSQNELATKLRLQCKVKMDVSGFEYMNQRYDGEYCIMQIMPHPDNSECSILYVNANSNRLYSKNFFTRQVILPMYANGRHPFLNNAALIFYEGKYKAIFEYGCNITDINF